jgi:hypothetical protein
MYLCPTRLLTLSLFSLLLFVQAPAMHAQDADAIVSEAGADPQSAPASESKSAAQEATSTTDPKPATPAAVPDPSLPVEDKRIMGVLPNYRTAEMATVYTPITAGYKMKIALKDSFDYPLFFIGAGYALVYQAEDNHSEFGQGTKGYFHRLGTSYADQVIGNMFTEGFFPILFHEDPRYFRMNEGKVSKRVLYSLSRIFVTKTDKGNTSFNFAEVLGNGAASAIGLSYYPDSRNFGDYMENWGIQLFTDATSQVLKEFWPDMKRAWMKKHPKHDSSASAPVSSVN